MKYGTLKAALVAVLWTGAFSIGIVGTLVSDIRLLFWGLMVAMVACIASGHLVACHAVRSDRVNLEHLVDGMIAGARDRSSEDVRPIR